MVVHLWCKVRDTSLLPFYMLITTVMKKDSPWLRALGFRLTLLFEINILLLESKELSKQ